MKTLAVFARLIAFLDPCRLTMRQIRKRYGEPSKTVQSNDVLHFYGRMMIMEMKSGKIRAVVRRDIMGTLS